MSEPFELSIIIPTFNEEENIAAILDILLKVVKEAKINAEILVVDDSSRDRTILIVREYERLHPDIRLIVREKDRGLSQSVVEGFAKATADFILVMDADFSHPPALVPVLYRELRKGYDLVIGSRYLPGGGIERWPLKRRIISLGATALGRMLIPDVTDPVSGFFALRREVLRNTELRPRGYKILLEILGKGRWKQVKEIPYEFTDRRVGSSKLRFLTIVDYASQVIDISLYAISRKDSAVRREWRRFFRFGIVGLTGIFVNMGILFVLTEIAGIFYLISSLIAIEISILNNFIWNDLWTFGDRRDNIEKGLKQRLLSFHAVSFGGLLINVGVLFALTELAGVYYLLSNLVGIFIAFIWNYEINRHYTWRTDKKLINR